jgi:hypothetical protein
MPITQEIYDKIDEIIIDALAESFVAHGHFMTGKIIEDIEIKREEVRGGANIDYYTYPYGVYLERGVKAENIPFSPGSGAKSSLYIDALISYVKRKFSISDMKEAKSMAFAIAHTQIKQGMPGGTGGEGSKWISDAIMDADSKMDVLYDYHYEMVDNLIENMIQRFNK